MVHLCFSSFSEEIQEFPHSRVVIEHTRRRTAVILSLRARSLNKPDFIEVPLQSNDELTMNEEVFYL